MVLWSGHKFEIGGVTFQSINSLDDLFTLKDEDGYIVGKYRSFIDRYVSVLADRKDANLIELGVFRGGSTVFLNELMRPRRLAAVEIATTLPPLLGEYMEQSPRGGAIQPFLGVDQSSIPDLESICRDYMADEPIDVVIDDASHFYDETKASFQFLFPRLRPGGIYVIEDWGWANQRDDIADIGPHLVGRKALSNLIVQIMLSAGSAPEIIPRVEVNRDFVVVHRGPAAISQPFELEDHCFYSGTPLDQTEFFGAARAMDRGHGPE